jgi:DNA polymerase elongation subunit (family B)
VATVLRAKKEGSSRGHSIRIKFLDGSERSIVAKRLDLIDAAAEEPDDVEEVESKDPQFKILVIDIETRPNLAYVWQVWNTNVPPSMIIDEKDVISFAAKWLGSDETVFYSVHDLDGEGKDRMVRAAWDLLNEADAVVHYNGKRFDIPHLNLEFLRYGYAPPSPFRQIDLLATVRREFKFTHNKLDHVADKLGIGRKIEHEGFALWTKCMAGEDEAWDRMREYNIHDVELTEQLYYEIRPWITNHPSHAALWGDARCPNCGSTELKLNGKQYTKTGRYQRYTCKGCGKHCRDTHRQSAAAVTETSAW